MSSLEMGIQGVLNGRALSEMYLQPDGSYRCPGFEIGPVDIAELRAWEYLIAAQVTGAPTGGGMQAWFEQIIPTSGFGASLPLTETNDAGGTIRQRLRGTVPSELALLPQGDFPDFAVRFDEGTVNPVVIARSILNVPHTLVVKPAFTGGTSPDVKLTIMRTPLTVVPAQLRSTDPVVHTTSGTTSSSTQVSNTLPLMRRVHRVSITETSNAGGAWVDVQLRDGGAGGSLLDQWRVPSGQTVQAVAQSERSEYVLTSGAQPYYLVSRDGANTGTCRIVTHGRS